VSCSRQSCDTDEARIGVEESSSICASLRLGLAQGQPSLTFIGTLFTTPCKLEHLLDTFPSMNRFRLDLAKSLSGSKAMVL
jgi:hypothetical protein